MEESNMQTTIGLLAHVDAGKTTLAEQMLYLSGTVRNPGRVDTGNTLLDFHEVEKRRGITVFLGQAELSYHGMQFQLLDTPGHVDFSAEMERSLAVLDYAVVIISLVEGVSGHTSTVFRLLQEKNIPTIFFFNKADREGADSQRVLSQLKQRMTKAAVLFPELCLSDNENDWNTVFEEAAEVNDTMLEMYLSAKFPEIQTIQTAVYKEIEACRLFPCICGSALRQQGIETLLKLLCKLKQHKEEQCMTEKVLSSEEKTAVAGRIYKIQREQKGERITFLKILKGNLKVKQEVPVRLASGEICMEKVDQIRIYSGEKYRLVNQADAGELCGITGFTRAAAGSVLGKELSVTSFYQKPILKTRLCLMDQTPIRLLLEALRVLQEEDPMLEVEYEERLNQISVHVMGIIQAEILKEALMQRFHINIEPGPCQVQYQETMKEPVMGYGHYEPLKHYAEVHLRLEPGARGTGIQAGSSCHVDVLAQNYQNLILQHIKEKEHKGTLIGAPLTDVRVVLTSGRAHIKHTEGGDFREAVYRAIRQGLCKAEGILLEPIYRFQITVPNQLSGRVTADIQRMYGTIMELETIGEEARLNGSCPAATMMDYPKELAAFTKGLGAISLIPDGYLPCHNAQEIIEQTGYEKEKDPDAISGSVFCSHGSGFYVPWQEVENYMHCPLEEDRQ